MKYSKSYLQFDAKLARFGFPFMGAVIKTWRWDEMRWNGRREDGEGATGLGRPNEGHEGKMKFL